MLEWPKTYFLCDTFVSCQTTMHSFLILRQNSKENVKHKCLIQFFMNTSELDDIPCLTNFSIYPKKHTFLFVIYEFYLFFDSEEYRFLLRRFMSHSHLGISLDVVLCTLCISIFHFNFASKVVN